MPTISRRVTLAAALLLVLVVAGVLLVLYGPRFLRSEPGLELPSVLPSVVVPSASAHASAPSGTPQPQPEVLLAVGDIGSCNSEADDAVADLADRLPGTIATLGDTAYDDGSSQEFAECFDPAWGGLKDRIRPAVGNHEYHTSNAAGYFHYFGQAAGEPREGWYSYELGAWQVVVLNSNCGDVRCDAGSPQVEWLRRELSGVAADGCLLAYWHAPRYSSGRHGSQDYVQPFWDELERAGVDVILNGHDHGYERVRVAGVRQFVVGTGGRSLYPFERGPLPETEVRSDEAYGLLWMELRADGYDWQFIGLGDTGFEDDGSADCE
jgi:hypothetical protein